MDQKTTDDEARRAREDEVAELIGRANDPQDDYDGHHGRDRTAEDFLNGVTS